MLGVGAGQQSRVDCVKLAGNKVRQLLQLLTLLTLVATGENMVVATTSEVARAGIQIFGQAPSNQCCHHDASKSHDTVAGESECAGSIH